MKVDPRVIEAVGALLGSAPPFDLACVGTSIHGLGAFTFESLACIAGADVVFYYPPSRNHFEFMRRVNANLVNVNETIYVKGTAFEPAYKEIVAEVMRSVRSGKKVAYAVQGSPAFHCGTAVRLHRLATEEGFSSILISGVSSLELLSAELAKHYDVSDLQIYSVGRLAAGNLRIDSRVPCLLFDLGRYALPAVREAASSFVRSKLTVLADRLRAIYPISHPILIMQVTDGVCRTVRTSPAEIESALPRFSAGVSIFLPSLSARAVASDAR
jgi:hypothetical protein